MKYKDPEKFQWRLDFFKVNVLPRLLQQTRQDFDILILCNPEHQSIIESLHPRIKTFNTNVPISGDEGYNKKSGESNSVEPFYYSLPYKIQSRLDSDDIISLDYVKIVRKALKRAKHFSVVAFKPYRFNWFKFKTFYIHPKDGRYDKSQFITIYDPKGTRFVYEMGHRKWADHVKHVKVIDFGHAWLSYHGNNASTKPKPLDEEVLK